MTMTSPEFVDLLASAAGGDVASAEKLFPLVYSELHRLAIALMRKERNNHTLQPTALSCKTTCTATLGSYQVASASGWRWLAALCVSPACF